jgi:hypothetical protein
VIVEDDALKQIQPGVTMPNKLACLQMSELALLSVLSFPYDAMAAM